jgi:predicted DNA-binding transcriptional regulator AlpA
MNQETNIVTNKSNNGIENKYFRVWDVACVTGRSERQVWRDARAGKIPKPFKQGHNTYWVRAEILAFMENLEQIRRN